MRNTSGLLCRGCCRGQIQPSEDPGRKVTATPAETPETRDFVKHRFRGRGVSQNLTHPTFLEISKNPWDTPKIHTGSPEKMGISPSQYCHMLDFALGGAHRAKSGPIWARLEAEIDRNCGQIIQAFDHHLGARATAEKKSEDLTT